MQKFGRELRSRTSDLPTWSLWGSYRPEVGWRSTAQSRLPSMGYMQASSGRSPRVVGGEVDIAIQPKFMKLTCILYLWFSCIESPTSKRGRMVAKLMVFGGILSVYLAGCFK